MEKEGRKEEEVANKRNESLLKKKFYLDKIGYGFSSTQFINIFFHLTGASLLLIGIINVLKSVFNTTLSTFIKEVTEKREISKRAISISGLIFGFTFLVLALAITIKSPLLFAISLLIGSLGVAIYGELFNNFLNKYSKKGKLSRTSSKSTLKGMLISAISIILAGAIIDLTATQGNLFTITLLGKSITQNAYGYLLTFEITAFAFIVSSYLFAKVRIKQDALLQAIDYKAYAKQLIQKSKTFLKNKYLLVLTTGMVLVSVFQAMMNSYTGIFVYNYFQTAWLGGFLNIAVMYSFALLTAILGPIITTNINKKMGVVPMFVFGALLMAMLPLVIAYNKYYPAIVAANAFSILGVALIGSSQGLLASKVLSVEDRQNFYSASGFISIIPFAILAIILAIIAQTNGLIHLFKILGMATIVLITPLYFLIVLWASNDG